jgi:hypothetical protein
MSRWELAFLIGGCLLLSLASVAVAWQFDVTEAALLDCYATTPAASQAATCRSLIDWGNVLTGVAPILSNTVAVIPLAVGLFLGAPLVAREIEHRTAPIAWSLSLSRRRWLATRTLPILVLVAVALLVLGQAAELLLRATEPDELGFRHYAMHGPLVAARGLAVFGIGLVVGLVLGRVLPAILVTGLATVALLLALSVGRDQLMREEAVWLPMGDQAEVVAMVYDSGFRSDRTGEVITWDEAYDRYPESFNEMGEGNPPGMTSVWRVVPPDRYPLYVAREVGALAIGVLVTGALAFGLIGRRRPG